MVMPAPENKGERPRFAKPGTPAKDGIETGRLSADVAGLAGRIAERVRAIGN
jgi:hypothetical protein